ncbi:MAG: hypothetical protein KGL39_11340 [Patescibacteria group bacterium]|nr:hypothetical protein [Patescibacteria group bacterium]
MSDSANVRIVVVEASGASSAISAAIAAFSGKLSAPAEAPRQTAAPVEEPRIQRALPAPRKAARRTAKTARAMKSATASPVFESNKPLSITDAIRAAVREAPRTNAEVLDAVRLMGINTESSTVSTILCQRRAANEMYKGEDLKWHFAKGR